MCLCKVWKRHSTRHAMTLTVTAQCAFKISMIHWVVQFALRIAFRSVLHRYTSREIHRWKSSFVNFVCFVVVYIGHHVCICHKQSTLKPHHYIKQVHGLNIHIKKQGSERKCFVDCVKGGWKSSTHSHILLWKRLPSFDFCEITRIVFKKTWWQSIFQSLVETKDRKK